MKFKKQGKLVLAMSCSLVASALADNPISNYHYLADPAATADDEYFYIITDSDDPAGSNGYTIKSLYAFRSRDMKNWTDFGIVLEAKREYDNIGDIWASGIDIGPDGRFYIVYPDGGGGGVGLVGADEIQGPYKNPVPDNKKLITSVGASTRPSSSMTTARATSPSVAAIATRARPGTITTTSSTSTSSTRTSTVLT